MPSSFFHGIIEYSPTDAELSAIAARNDDSRECAEAKKLLGVSVEDRLSALETITPTAVSAKVQTL